MQRKIVIIISELRRLFPNVKPSLEYSNSWQMLVAVILSARNTDKKVNEVTKNLFGKYRNIKDYENADIKALEKDLGQLGLFRQKAKFIKETANIIDEKYDGKIPITMNDLTSLPGVGRKTANVILGRSGIIEGIAVDTHVTRLSRLFGLTTTKNPDKIEQDLMKIISKKDWPDFTNLMIAYGRKYCKASCKHKICHLKNFIV